MTPRELRLDAEDPLAQQATQALVGGDVESLEGLLEHHPELATARVLGTGDSAGERSLLHLYADWPGHRPNPREIVAVLAGAGADVNARYVGEAHSETPLHWAASNDDVELIDALLDAGADLEAAGAVVGGGTPIADATAFGQWQAADRLLAHGARTNLFQAATLGLSDRLSRELAASPPPDAAAVTQAFWGACHGGRQSTASQLLLRGAELNWVGYDDLTPLGAAERSGADDVAAWLRAREAFADLAVVIAGDDSGDGAHDDHGGERRRLERHAARIGLADHVRFVGAVPHEQLGDYYAMADICVVPSLTESFGLVALEAQALGTPVVAASVGGLREIVEDGVTGFLIDGHEPVDYARAIAEVLKDPVRMDEMGEEARRRAGRFTWRRAVDRLAAIYDRLSAEGQPPGSPCGYEDEEAFALMGSAAS